MGYITGQPRRPPGCARISGRTTTGPNAVRARIAKDRRDAGSCRVGPAAAQAKPKRDLRIISHPHAPGPLHCRDVPLDRDSAVLHPRRLGPEHVDLLLYYHFDHRRLRRRCAKDGRRQVALRPLHLPWRDARVGFARCHPWQGASRACQRAAHLSARHAATAPLAGHLRRVQHAGHCAHGRGTRGSCRGVGAGGLVILCDGHLLLCGLRRPEPLGRRACPTPALRAAGGRRLRAASCQAGARRDGGRGRACGRRLC